MSFTPIASLAGGFMLSLSTTSLLASHGRVLGASGITHSCTSDVLTSVRKSSESKEPSAGLGGNWKAWCLGGMLVGGGLLGRFEGSLSTLVGTSVFGRAVDGLSIWRTVIAGLLVGAGTKLGSGCTSGHMLCGLSKFSYRSFIATLTFFSTALITAQVYPGVPVPSTISFPSTFSLTTAILLQLPFVLYTLIPYILSPALSSSLCAFFTGVHFSFALALAGMLSPTKVVSFFYLPIPFLPMYGLPGREWDPSLVMVALGGLLPNILLWRSIKSWSTPLWSEKWSLSDKVDVDWKLVVGSTLFGVGWGLSGICPGPLIANLGAGVARGVIVPFFVAFVTGGVVADLIA